MLPEDICVIVTYDDNYQDMADVTVAKNISQYCQLYGYHLHIDKRTVEGRHSAWNKIAVCMEMLSKYKWLFYIDTDCLIMNHTIRLESLVDDRYSFIVPSHFIPAIDTPIYVDWKTDNIISSQFFVQNTEMGKEILQDIWNAKESGEDINKFDYEGRQMRHTITKPEFSPYVKIIEERLLNTFWWTASPFVAMYNENINSNCWKPGDFIAHVTGYKKEWRVEILEHLNHYSGGLVVGYTRKKGKVIFTPLVHFEKLYIEVMETDTHSMMYYNMDNVSKTMSYTLYTDGFDNSPLIVKAFDGVKLVSIKYLPC